MADIASPIKTLGSFPAIDPTVAAIGTADQIADGAAKVSMTVGERAQVSASKTASSRWTALDPAVIEEGFYYAWNSGSKVANAAWTSKSYAAVPGTTYRVTASIGGAATGMTLFFDAAGAFMAGSGINQGGVGYAHYKRELFTVPAGAAKMVVSGSNTGGAPILVEQPVMIAQAGQQIADASADTARLRSFTPLTLAWTAGFFVSTSTGGQVASGTVSNALIPVDGGETMRVSGTLVASASLAIAMVTFLDPRGIPISALYAPTTDSTTVSKTNQEFQVPGDCRTVAVTLTTTSIPSAKVERFDIADRVLQITRDRIGAAEAAQAATDANLDRLKSFYSTGGAPIVGEYYNRSNGAVVANALWHRLAPVAVTPGQEIRVTGTTAGAATALILFLNASMIYLSRMFDGVSGSPVEHVDEPIIVPAGAAYACVCSYISTSNTEPVVKVYGINPAIAAAGASAPLEARIATLEAPVSRLRRVADRLVGRKTLWAGTSIPAGTTTLVTIEDYTGPNRYPSMVAAMTGMTVVNVALGSSIARAGVFANKNAPGGDPLGWTGVNWDNLWRSLSMTAAEKDELINNWESKWRALLSGSGKPTTLDAATQASWRGASYESRIVPNLDADIFVLDHGNNDAAIAPGGYEAAELVERFSADPASRDRTTFHGAINYLIDVILAAKPKARIIFCGHYENARKAQISQAQMLIADLWDSPIIKLWERAGWSQQVITGTGADAGKTLTQLWMPDNLHPHSDTTGEANWHLAKLITADLQSKT